MNAGICAPPEASLVEGRSHADAPCYHVLGEGVGNGCRAVGLNLVYGVNSGVVPNFHEELLGGVQRDKKTIIRIVDNKPPFLDDVIQFFGIRQNAEF